MWNPVGSDEEGRPLCSHGAEKDCSRCARQLYKLTDREGYTRRGNDNETLWGENVTHSANGRGGLCTSGLIHAYEHPLLAAFMNPIDAALENPVLWEAEGEIVAREGQLKCGVKTLTTLRRIDLPLLTTTQRIAVSIKCTLLQYSDPAFVKWANSWLDRSHRSARAAEAAWAAARAAARAAGAAGAAAEAAWAAARAAGAARAAARAAGADEMPLLHIIQEVLSDTRFQEDN